MKRDQGEVYNTLREEKHGKMLTTGAVSVLLLPDEQQRILAIKWPYISFKPSSFTQQELDG